MRHVKTILIFSFTVLILVTGCRIVDEPVELRYHVTESGGARASASDRSIAMRFIDTQNEAANPVESALSWAKRYDRLSEKVESLEEKSNKLMLENTELKYQFTQNKHELEQAKKELTEANEFLQDLELELTRWKSDVIGNRDEIRDAHTAQLLALRKIMRILGAEMTEVAETE